VRRRMPGKKRHQQLRTGRGPPSVCAMLSCSPVEVEEVAMAKGQIRSNREKKKPKQDKNKKKDAEAPSAFKPGTTYTSQYGKKH